MKIAVEYWYLILAAVAVLGIGVYSIIGFFKQPTSKQMESVREWLLWAVTKAEKELGSGTGQLKLRYVYDMFVEKFGFLAKMVSFDMISELVDEALEELNEILTNNEKIEKFVTGDKSKEE